jgi:cytochrome oxidase Cu insertion factor (SCO1/SenC/PrrC family)
MTKPHFSRWSREALLAGLALLVTLLTVACTGRATPTDAAGAYDGTALDGPASDFRLVDQHGATVALSDFRGQVVALAFLDTQCKDVCPLTALHLRKAYQALGDQATSVVFLGVNVNVEVNRVADVKATTEKWQLNEVPTWHFMTGSAEELKPVWKAYHILVIPTSAEDQDPVHTPGVYLIDRTEQMRWYISTPFDDAGTPQWTPPLSELLVKHIRELLRER